MSSIQIYLCVTRREMRCENLVHIMNYRGTIWLDQCPRLNAFFMDFLRLRSKWNLKETTRYANRTSCTVPRIVPGRGSTACLGDVLYENRDWFPCSRHRVYRVQIMSFGNLLQDWANEQMVSCSMFQGMCGFLVSTSTSVTSST